MKRLIFFSGLIISAVFACKMQRQTVNIEYNQSEEESRDSIEYSLETFDTKFETWYALHNSPSHYRAQQYYEGWNRIYVSAWNYNATVPRKNRFFEYIVGYDPTIDYGFELNHKLFFYFMYVEKVLNIEIMKGGPRAAHF